MNEQDMMDAEPMSLLMQQNREIIKRLDELLLPDDKTSVLEIERVKPKQEEGESCH